MFDVLNSNLVPKLTIQKCIFVDGIFKWTIVFKMEAVEQCFPVVLFIMPYKVVLTFASVG